MGVAFSSKWEYGVTWLVALESKSIEFVCVECEGVCDWQYAEFYLQVV